MEKTELLLHHDEVFDLVTGDRKLVEEHCQSVTADQQSAYDKQTKFC